MKRRVMLSILMIVILCLNPFQNVSTVEAYGMAKDKTFVIYSGGSFVGTNAQSGAINMYLVIPRLLSVDSKVYVEYKDASGNVENFYWVASEAYREDDGNQYSVNRSFIHTLYPDGESISFKVISGSMAVGWPDDEETMPYSYSEGNPTISETADPGSDEKNEEQSFQAMQEIADKLGLSGFFKDGKFIMYSAKAVDKYVLSDTDLPALGNFWNMFSPDGFCVKDEGSPFALSSTVRDDGNILWKFVFPSDYDEEKTNSFKNVLNDANAWDEYKNKVDLMSQTIDDIKSLSEDVKDQKYMDYLPDIAVYFGGTEISSSELASLGGSVENDEIFSNQMEVDNPFSGYLELVTDSKLNYLSGSGKVAGGFEADGKHYIRQYFSPVGFAVLPWFWSVDYDFDGCAQLGIECSQDKDGKVNIKRDGNIKANGKLEGNAGVGIYGAANVSGNLKGNIVAEMFPRMSLSTNGTLSLSARFLNYYKQNLIGPLEFSHTFWDMDKEDMLEDDVIQLNLSLNKSKNHNTEMHLLSRDFLDKTTTWEGEEPVLADVDKRDRTVMARQSLDTKDIDFDIEGAKTSGVYLQKWTMEGSAPQVVKIGDKEVMIYLTMTEDGTTSNAGRLMYSVKSDGVWSKPVEVWDNGQTDYFADVKVVGDTLYLTWQKSSDHVVGSDAEKQMEDAIAKSEICVATFDEATATFTGQQYVTKNDYVDMLPQIVCESNVPAIAWVSNTKNSIDGIKEANTIVYSVCKNGTWSEGKTLTEAQGYIGNYVVYQNDTDYDVVYSSMDLSQYTEGKDLASFLYFANKSGTKLLDSGKNSIIGLQYSGGSLYWLSDNIFKEFNCKSEMVNTLTTPVDVETQKNVGANFIVNSENGKKSVVWSTAQENGYAMYSALIGTDEISNRIKLFEREGASLESFSVVLQSDGSYDFLMDELIDEEKKQYALSEIVKEEADDILLEMVDMTDLNRTSVNKQSINVLLKNNGETTLNNIHIKVMSGETVYLNTTLSKSAAPGEKIFISDQFRITKIQQPKKFKVYIYGDNQTEKEAQVYETVLGKTNLSLTMEKMEKNGKRVVKCKVTNESDTPSSGEVHLYSGIDAMNQLQSMSFDELAAGESESLYFDIDSTKISFDGDIGLAYQAKLESKVPDYQCSNNSAMVILYASDFNFEDKSNENGGSGTEDEKGECGTGGDESEKGKGESGIVGGETESGKGESETGTGAMESGKGESGTGATESEKKESETGGDETEKGKGESEPGGNQTESGKDTTTAENAVGDKASSDIGGSKDNISGSGGTIKGENTSSGQTDTVLNGSDDQSGETNASKPENNTNKEATNTTVKPSVSAVSKFKASSGKNRIVLTWKRTPGISGYQIQLSTSKKFKKVRKYTVKVSKQKYVIKHLSSKKKYYVRICAYKTYKDKTGQRKRVYGPYKKVSIKTK